MPDQPLDVFALATHPAAEEGRLAMDAHELTIVNQQLPSIFTPEQARLNDLKVDAVIPALARLEDWERMREAIHWKLEHLHALVGWWAGNVSVREGPGRGGLKSVSALQSISLKDAERTTGFTKVQISRVRSRLKDPAAYAQQSKDTSLVVMATEVRERAERRLGELMTTMPKAEGAKGNPGGRGAPIVRVAEKPAHPALASLGIDKNLANRARQRKDAKMEAWVAKIRVRAVHRIGELSRDLERTDKDTRFRSDGLPTTGKPTKAAVLREAGLSTSVAHRCEQVAARIRSEARTSTTQFPKWAHRPILDVSIRWPRGRRMPRDTAPPPTAVTVAVAGGRVGRVTPCDDAGSFKVEVVGHDWIGRLASVGWLDADQVEAAERLRHEFDRSGVHPRLCGSYRGHVDSHSGEFALEQLDADQLRAWRRLGRLLSHVPKRERHQVESVVLWGATPWDVRALQTGLQALAAALRRPRR